MVRMGGRRDRQTGGVTGPLSWKEGAWKGAEQTTGWTDRWWGPSKAERWDRLGRGALPGGSISARVPAGATPVGNGLSPQRTQVGVKARGLACPLASVSDLPWLMKLRGRGY